MTIVKMFEGENPNVRKYVFEWEDAIAESVIYAYPTYEHRTVLCVSVQSGCPVGCSFCGTGRRFVRDLQEYEILEQVSTVFAREKIRPERVQKLQLMFMSMGEPFLNYGNVTAAMRVLYQQYPQMDLLVSTIFPKTRFEIDFLDLSMEIPKVGLQFSLHEFNDERRNIKIPYKLKHTIQEIKMYGMAWWAATGRHPFLNYIVDGDNSREQDAKKLMEIFPKQVFNFTFSVLCSPNKNCVKHSDMDQIKQFQQYFLDAGYNVRIFDPAGQDDIGGGCGQLWYVQDYLRRK